MLKGRPVRPERGGGVGRERCPLTPLRMTSLNFHTRLVNTCFPRSERKLPMFGDCAAPGSGGSKKHVLEVGGLRPPHLRTDSRLGNLVQKNRCEGIPNSKNCQNNPAGPPPAPPPDKTNLYPKVARMPTWPRSVRPAPAAPPPAAPPRRRPASIRFTWGINANRTITFLSATFLDQDECAKADVAQVAVAQHHGRRSQELPELVK